LEALILSDNYLTGHLPSGDEILPDDRHNNNTAGTNDGGKRWSDLSKLTNLALNNNHLTGPLIPQLLLGLSKSLVELDIGYNKFNGTISPVIGKLTQLQRLYAQGNFLSGTLPPEMNRMNPDIHLNLTNNL
jgi:Leucine-rich repeat (LRR) protein